MIKVADRPHPIRVTLIVAATVAIVEIDNPRTAAVDSIGSAGTVAINITIIISDILKARMNSWIIFIITT